MNYPKLSIPLVAVMLLTTFSAKAQIVGKSTDTNYYNTTIIYKKGNLNDTDILQKVDNDYGMGDVIRIADAPSKPKSDPVVQAPQRNTYLKNTAEPVVVKPIAMAQPAQAAPSKMVVTPAKEEVKQVRATTTTIKKSRQPPNRAALQKIKNQGQPKYGLKRRNNAKNTANSGTAVQNFK